MDKFLHEDLVGKAVIDYFSIGPQLKLLKDPGPVRADGLDAE